MLDKIYWGRGLLIGGVLGLVLSLSPAMLLFALPQLADGFIAILATMLTITVAPLALLFASAGAVLLLVGLVQRRGRD